MEVSIVMPCLNEAETLEVCIKKSMGFLAQNGVTGEVVIADNGSEDGSLEIARKNGARVIDVKRRGYGAALIAGIKASEGRYVIIGDSDDSYDFSNLMPYLVKLREGYELVMGNRFKGGIAKNAMPPLHKYLGNPVLSLIGRIFFYRGCGDFHCGLRGFNRDAILRLELKSSGMEFASEMIIRSALAKLKITEVPTTLSPDGRSRPPHLRSWRDGWRHLRLLLIWSPKWLFLYPGLGLIMFGLFMSLLLIKNTVHINDLSLDINTLLFQCSMIVVGCQAVFFSIHTNLYGRIHNLLPSNSKFERFINYLSLEKGLLIGGSMILTGFILALYAVYFWSKKSFGELDPSASMRIVIPSCFFIIMGSTTVFNIFFLHVLQYLNDNKKD